MVSALHRPTNRHNSMSVCLFMRPCVCVRVLHAVRSSVDVAVIISCRHRRLHHLRCFWSMHTHNTHTPSRVHTHSVRVARGPNENKPFPYTTRLPLSTLLAHPHRMLTVESALNSNSSSHPMQCERGRHSTRSNNFPSQTVVFSLFW